MSRRISLLVGRIIPAVLLAVGATLALTQRASNLQTVAIISADLGGLDLITARMAAMGEADRLRIRLIEQGWAAIEEIALGPALAAAEELLAAAAPIAEGDGPTATEASVLRATLEGRLEDVPQDGGYADAMWYLDNLVGDFCCAGQTGSIRGVSDWIRTLDYLTYAQGTYSYFLDDFVGGLQHRDQTPIEPGGFADYMAYNRDLARAGNAYSDVDDPLTADFPPQIDKDDPALAANLATILHSPPADLLRRSVSWAVQGGAAAGDPAPATFEQVVGSIESIQIGLGDLLADTLVNEESALAARAHRLQGMGWLLLALAAAGYLAAAVLVGRQLKAIRRLQIESEARRRETQAKMSTLSTVAHEMRTPLTGITGYSRILQQDWETLDREQIAEFLAIIDDQASELSRLVDDLLTARRLETGQLELHPAEVAVAEIAGRVAQGVFCGGPSLFLMDLDPQLRVVTDPQRLGQILRNLLDNARKYGGRTARLTAREVGGRCRISVIDDGNGIAPEDVERVFNCFDRGSAPHSAASGFGLGLSIVRDLARAMGGDAGYRPAEPRGAEFWVDLPMPARHDTPEPVGAGAMGSRD
ncbi:MAG: HAMP domain-containing histidine kinase [Acidimicrobiia bacterium]|nr:HAMP domain-containing histidine kinase [Acidimicrobiia bacterium]